MKTTIKFKDLRTFVTLTLVVLNILISNTLTAQKNNIPLSGPHNSLIKRPVEYDLVQERLATGWNTYDTRSVITHVLMPESFAVQLGLRVGEKQLNEALIGRFDAEVIKPGPRTWNNDYTELNLSWEGITINIQSTVHEGNLVLLITPEKVVEKSYLTIAGNIKWNREGIVDLKHNRIEARFSNRIITVRSSESTEKYNEHSLQVPLLETPLVVYTGNDDLSVAQAKKLIDSAYDSMMAARQRFGENENFYSSMQSVLAWDTIYEPEYDRVVPTVSRIWNSHHWNGWVLFDWDTYFAAYMAAIDNKDLAYSSAYEITRHLTPEGFVPNYASGRGSSFDRSQPPVGSLVVRELYRRYKDKWFVESLFDALLSWNRWWPNARDNNGYLCWGSSPFPGEREGEIQSENHQAAMYESGLDNSVMYDGVPFNKQSSMMELADVGLMSFYVADCDALYELAKVLGRKKEADELKKRQTLYTEKLKTLWNSETGIYQNKRTDTDKFSSALSPTLFYTMLAKVADQKQVDRMLKEHLLNNDEFWGEWVVTMTPWNDPKHKDNTYWRGRIWAPVNFLVYLGLRNYNNPDVQREFAQKSGDLLLKEWQEHGHVHENYSPISGRGCDVNNSDRFYHWGALLSTIPLIEAGIYDATEDKLK